MNMKMKPITCPLTRFTAPTLARRTMMQAAWMACLAPWLLSACSKPADAPAAASAGVTYAAVARGKVDIEGGLLQLSMPVEGVLSKVAVHEGDHVSKGQLLAQLDTEPATLAVASAQAGLEQAQAQLKLLQTQQQAAKQRAGRLAAAAAAGAGDGQAADDAREAASRVDAELAAARAALDEASEKLAQARYALKQHSLLAPIDADVVQVAAQPGASVSPTSGPLLTLLPAKPRIVRAELNESFVGAVHPGMPAQVVANDDSSAHWSAHVLRIGNVYGPATLENDPQVRANARTVECVLAFDQPQALRIGQRVVVRFGTPGSGTASPTPKD